MGNVYYNSDGINEGIKVSQKTPKRQRFEKVAARRVQKVIDFLDSLSNCANRSNYEYDDEDVKKMFRAIREKLSQTESVFGKLQGKEGKKQFTF